MVIIRTKKLQSSLSPYQKHKNKWSDCTRCHLCRGRQHVVLCRGKIPCDILLAGEAPGVSEDVIGIPFTGPAGHLLEQMITRAWDGQFDYCITNVVGCLPLVTSPVVVNAKTEEYDLMIDRSSEWGNPFIITKTRNRWQVIEDYRDWLSKQTSLLKKIPTLAGKRLGCHCKPLACHGDVIVETFNRLVDKEKMAEPPEDAIKACMPKLQEMVMMCKPKLIVTIGKLADKWVPKAVEGLFGLSTSSQDRSCLKKMGWKKPRWCSILHPAFILRLDPSQQGLAIQKSVVSLEDAVIDL